MELAVYYYPPEGGLEFVLKDGCAIINSNIVNGDFGTIKIEPGMNYRDLVNYVWSQVPRRQRADFFNLGWISVGIPLPSSATLTLSSGKSATSILRA